MKGQHCVYIRVRLADVLSRIEQALQLLDREMLGDCGIRCEHVEKRLPRLHRRFRGTLNQMMCVEPADAVAERKHHRFAENQAVSDLEVRCETLDVDVQTAHDLFYVGKRTACETG